MENIPKEEIERIRENLKRQKIKNRLLSSTPEFQEQARLFRTWVALSNVPNIKCPVCNKGELSFTCGHGDVGGALKLAGDMVIEHSKETNRVHREITKKHPELDMI